jgi:hypothetical protein
MLVEGDFRHLEGAVGRGGEETYHRVPKGFLNENVLADKGFAD